MPSCKKLPATVQTSNSVEHLLSVSTPIHIDTLEYYLHDYPDPDFVSYLLHGLRHGFHTGLQQLPQQSLECKNLLSARGQPDVTTNLIQDEVTKGYLAGPFEQVPFPIYRTNPIGIAEGRYSHKKRLIVDLSAPHNDPEHMALNDLINKEDYSLQYITVDHAIACIKKLGPGSWLSKMDISDAFKQIPICETLWPYHGIKWQGSYYFFTKLDFGSRSSSRLFDMLATAVCWIATYKFHISNIMHLLDDFLTIDPPLFPAKNTMSKLTELFQALNIPIAQHKTLGPTQCLEFLGIILDTLKMEARLPADKIQRICDILQSFLDVKSCTKRQILSLLGHLQFACRVIHPGRSFVSYLISLSTSVHELHHHVKLTEECRLDIDMWFKFLSNWNGVSFFLNDNITTTADMCLYTDATDRAYGGIYGNLWFQGSFAQDLDTEGDKKSMAFCELYPIVMACVLWGHQWCRQRILFYCDNQSTVDIINKGRSKVKLIMKLMRKLTWCSANHNFVVHAKHLPTYDNTTADAISRFQMNRFRCLAPWADQHPTPCIPHSDLLQI